MSASIPVTASAAGTRPFQMCMNLPLRISTDVMDDAISCRIEWLRFAKRIDEGCHCKRRATAIPISLRQLWRLFSECNQRDEFAHVYHFATIEDSCIKRSSQNAALESVSLNP